MFVESFLVSIIVALVRKGKIKNLGLIQLQRISLLFTALFLQKIIDYPEVMISEKAGVIIHLISYVLLFYFFGINKNQINWLFPLGTFLNFLVILLNNGSMPVRTAYMPLEAVEQLKLSITHSLITTDTRLVWLADIIYVQWPIRQMLSVGDVILDIGMFIFIQKIMIRKKFK